MKWFIVYLIMINFIGLIMMKVDKYKAIHQRWRIQEMSFFVVSLLGGSLGVWTGMYLFHHKTKHWSFILGVPLILLIQAYFMFCRI